MTFSDTQQQGAAGDVPARLSHRQITTVMSGLVLSMFLGALDQTVVSSALRTIADDLHGLTAQAWVTTAYLITATIATPLYGKLSDIHGRRPVYLAAIALFTVGSLLCGCAGSIYELAAFRAVQGLGGGGLMSLAMTIAADVTTPRERGRYQGYFIAVFGGASIVGPLVGGAFAGRATLLGIDGWRWIFLINVPLAAAAAMTIVRVLRIPHRRVRHRLDYFGALALAVGLVPLLTVAEQGRTWGWSSPRALLAYAMGLVGLAVFVVVERRMGDAALLPPRLFRIRAFRLGVGLHFVVGIGMFGAMTTLPLYLQLIRGMSPMAAGLATLPTVAANLAVTLLVGRLIARTGRFKVHLVAGLGSFTAAMLVFATLRVGSPLWYAALGMALMGAGLGASMQTLTTLAQCEVPHGDMGAATASVNFFRSNGGTVGTTAFLSILFTTATGHIADRLAQARHHTAYRRLLAQPDNAHALAGVLRPGGGVGLEDSAFLHALDPGAALPFLEGYVASLRLVFLTGAAVVLVAFLIAAWRVPNLTLSDQ
ncbi:EmrB/QacA subfamily drug resistance transporter [Streptomyces griseochromogenes]|uniref:EmrB/QacA subfamily drug resistance transporter n=1 Tax=Streptomyces griseochromogenes TaxID=68214 RepID=A0A1B1AYL7_9ACTN|nr:MDR family MFS transporter [Streptomyces griseochromogenes]ANP51668.1 MFS transporter [Streptomyces griseochromogenes]MBP2054214.1 EmrB/QacA subfamily drug resistance transporter [Streptomyces griseochromogenes]